MLYLIFGYPVILCGYLNYNTGFIHLKFQRSKLLHHHNVLPAAKKPTKKWKEGKWKATRCTKSGEGVLTRERHGRLEKSTDTNGYLPSDYDRRLHHHTATSLPFFYWIFIITKIFPRLIFYWDLFQFSNQDLGDGCCCSFLSVSCLGNCLFIFVPSFALEKRSSIWS